MTYSKHVPAAERTMRLLELLASAPDGLPAGEMLGELLFSRSALFALLNTLKSAKTTWCRKAPGAATGWGRPCGTCCRFNSRA